MMGGNFGSEAGAFLLIPVLVVFLAIGAGLGIGLFMAASWLWNVVF
jgi:hypothetical protein